MRRKDREITDFAEIVKIMEKCDVCRLAMNDGDYPYILPLNFGMKVENRTVILYFHGADQGRKYEVIEKDNRASFEMDCSHELVFDEKKAMCTMKYESVIGRGRVEILPEEEKMDALVLLTDRYHEKHFKFGTGILPHTVVMKLTVEEMTGKRR